MAFYTIVISAFLKATEFQQISWDRQVEGPAREKLQLVLGQCSDPYGSLSSQYRKEEPNITDSIAHIFASYL